MDFSGQKFLLIRIVSYVCIAIAFRWLLFYSFPAILTGDSSGYLASSYQIRHAADFTNVAERAVMLPGYPVFLAITAPITQMNASMIVLMQKALGILSVLIAFLIGIHLRLFLLAELVVLFVAFNPVFMLFEHAISPETVYIFLLLLFTYCWLNWVGQRPTFLLSFFVGLLFSLSILTRTNGLIYSGFLIASGLYLNARGKPLIKWYSTLKRMRSSLVGLGLGLLLIIPWLWLNYSTHQRVALVHFNNRNLLLYKAMHDPLDENLTQFYEFNESIGQTFGQKWIYTVKTEFSTIEAEEIARTLYIEQLTAHPGLHVTQMRYSLLNFYGRYENFGNELATMHIWASRLLPDTNRVFEIAQRVMYQQNPEFVYVPISEQAPINKIWSQLSLFFLTAIRPILAVATLISFCAILFFNRRDKFLFQNQSLFWFWIIFIGYISTVAVHVITLATNDRYTTPFDWILVLILIAFWQLKKMKGEGKFY